MTLGFRQKVVSKVKSVTAGEVRRYHHVAFDNGDGKIVDAAGTVNYATGEFILPVLPIVTESVWNSSDAVEAWQSGSSESHAFTTGIVTCSYTPSAASSADITPSFAIPAITIQIIPAGLDEVIVQGSLSFTAGGYFYKDRAGDLIRNTLTSTSDYDVVGSVDYVAGTVIVNDVDGGLSDFAIQTLLTRYGDWATIKANFRTQLAPLKPEALSITAVTEDGEQISASADGDGVISGEWVRGYVNYNFGTATMEFGKIVSGDFVPRRIDPSSIRYNAVSYKYIPLSADILGVDAVRLPSDGRVPIYRAGDLVVIANTDETAPATKTNGQQIDSGRTRLGWVKVLDNDGLAVSSTRYTLDRAGGKVTMDDVSGLSQPLTLRHTIADLRMITDAQISGVLTLSRALSFEFPTEGTIVAGCLLHGDRRARVSTVFDQNSWDGTWKDVISGSAATATLDVIAHPVVVTNEGAETERWVLRWTNATNVELIGETRGLVFTGAFNANIAPINPRTRDEGGLNGVPYLTIPVAANGGGWSAGNVVRINTVGAIAPIWMARSIMQSDEPLGDGADGCEIHALGNIDRP